MCLIARNPCASFMVEAIDVMKTMRVKIASNRRRNYRRKFTLVQYVQDDIYHIVESSKIRRSNNKSIIKAKYLDRIYYDAEVVAKHSSKQLLTEIVKNLVENVPIVILPRIENPLSRVVEERDILDCQSEYLLSEGNNNFLIGNEMQGQIILDEAGGIVSASHEDTSSVSETDNFSQSKIDVSSSNDNNNYNKDTSTNEIGQDDYSQSKKKLLSSSDDDSINSNSTEIDPFDTDEDSSYNPSSSSSENEDNNSVTKRDISITNGMYKESEYVIDTSEVIGKSAEKNNKKKKTANSDCGDESITMRDILSINEIHKENESVTDTSEIVEMAKNMNKKKKTTNLDCDNESDPMKNIFLTNEIHKEYESVMDISKKSETADNINKNKKTSNSDYVCTEEQNKETNDTSFVIINQIPNSNSSRSKQYFCKYCKKLVCKFGRHLEQVHKNEAAVKNFILLPKGSKERKNIIDKIRKDGNFLFNTKNAYNNGQLIVSRRPNNKLKKSTDYKVCPNCKEFFSKLSIRRHYRKCDLNSKKGDRNLFSLSRLTHGQIHQKAENNLKTKIFPKLRDDEVTRILRYDKLAIIYGNKLCSKYRKPHLEYFIRSKLRLIGRLLIAIKKINPLITDFTSMFNPIYYDDVIKAVNQVALLNEECDKYKSPATAFSIGTLLKKCGKTLINEFIREGNELGQTTTKNFLSIVEEDFAISVNKTVEENQKENRRNKKIQLPTMNDIKLLNNYLNVNRKRNMEILSNKFDYGAWLNLAKYTLISVQIFNRRRAGEIERITISDFKTYQTVDENTDQDIYNSLSSQSKMAAKQYIRFEIRGKLARGVAVLLSKDLFASISTILKYRNQARVSEKNEYVFGIPGGDNKYLRACFLLRKFSVDCGASNPASLRGTELRKHIATRSILLNLQEEEVSDLANFMGHADKIHKDHYRIPIVARDITRMSRLLEMAQGNEGQINTSDTGSVVAEDICSIPIETMNEEYEQEQDQSETEKEGIETEKEKGRKTRSVSPVGNIKRLSWSTPEKQVALQFFSDHIKSHSLPSVEYCQTIISKNKELQNRSPLQLKSWISNQMKKTKSASQRTRDIGCEKQNFEEHTKYWTNEEKQIMCKIFSENVCSGKLPSYSECERAIKENEELGNRTKQTIKAWVYNEIKKKKI